jgi:hypothetical protein
MVLQLCVTTDMTVQLICMQRAERAIMFRQHRVSLAGWLADSAYLDSHCPSRHWSPTITGWNSATEHNSTYLILKVPLLQPPSLHGRQLAFVPCPGLSHILIWLGSSVCCIYCRCNKDV